MKRGQERSKSMVNIQAKKMQPAMAWLKHNSAPFLWSIFRFILLIGISYVILYPIAVKLALVFMDKSNLNDITVKWIPRDFTLDNI